MGVLQHAATILAVVCAATAQNVSPNNSTMPTAQFITRPLGYAPILNVTLYDDPSPGYVFVAPYLAASSGPYIYDKHGNLVWDGFGVIGAANAHNFHVCQYKDEPHLCLYAGNQRTGFTIGTAMIVDSNYQIVKSIQTGGNVVPADLHEFQLVNGETALLSAYQTFPYDMSTYGVTSQQGWLSEGIFQEVNVTTGEVLFEWCSANHVDPKESMVAPRSSVVVGDGATPHTAFDYFHLNSIDKSTATNNYLISSRHASTIYLISAADRSIIWKLSCARMSDFKCNGFNFTYQHDARFLNESANTTVISIFDNASNGNDQSNSQSAGMIISIDHKAREATLISEIHAPIDGGLLSASQGNFQTLANGGAFISWGQIPAFSEYKSGSTGNFTAVFFATITDVKSDTTENYRAFSFEWESTPAYTRPSVYSFSRDTQSALAVYVSWNGATTPRSWNFYGSEQALDGFEKIGNTERTGFETLWQGDNYYPWIIVEALDGGGKALRNSTVQATFVPSSTLSAACGDTGCPVSEPPAASSSS